MKLKRRTWRGVVVVAAVLVCALAGAPGARARQLSEARAQLDADGRWVNGVTESWWMDEGITSADAGVAAARWKEIGDDGARAAGWAGDYFRGGETHGTYMRWSPRGGFVIARVDKCRAAVMGLVSGRVEATPTLVQFFPELDKQSAGGHGHHGATQHAAKPRDVLRFVPVEWRGRRLLIAEEEMEDFGDYVAGLGRHNEYSGLFFLEYDIFFRRSGEGAGDGGAPPVVPPDYRRFIKKPIEARVTSVGRRVLKRDYTIEGKHTSQAFARASVTPVTINAGTEHGVKEGMVFRVARPAEGDTVIVLRAGRRTSTAAVVRDAGERGAETFYDNEQSRERRHSRVARGWRLTTSLYD